MSTRRCGTPAGTADGRWAAARQNRGMDEGGDAACWLDQVCEECGRLRERSGPGRCEHCGAVTEPGAGAGPAAAACTAAAAELRSGAGDGGDSSTEAGTGDGGDSSTETGTGEGTGAGAGRATGAGRTS